MKTLDFTETKGPIGYAPTQIEYISFGQEGTLRNTIMVLPDTCYSFEPKDSARLLYIYSKHEMENRPWWEVKPELQHAED